MDLTRSTNRACSHVAPSVDSNSLLGGIGGDYWRSQVGKAGLFLQGLCGLLIGALYHYQSGPWSGPVITRRLSSDPAFGASTVTLPNGRVVSNPLATPLRFAYPTRAEGQFALGATHLLNLRLASRLALAGRRYLDTAVDVMNVTNNDADQALQIGGNYDFSAFFGQGRMRQFPRMVLMSARFS